MLAFRVRSGIDRSLRIPEAQVIIIGRHRYISALSFDDLVRSKLYGVNRCLYNASLEQLLPGSVVPLYGNLATMIALQDDVSRANTPSSSVEMFQRLKEMKIAHGVKQMSIVLYAEYDHVYASTVAAVRAFPTFNRKSERSRFEAITLEIVVTDTEPLGQRDIQFLQTLCDSIRIYCRQVDTPSNILHSEAFIEEAVELIDDLGGCVSKTIIKGDDLFDLGFGGIYHVGKAAKSPPIFACFSYKPEGALDSFALVGKSITFDTGGMQIKGKTSMPSMKVDMAGGACALAAFCALVKSGFKAELSCVLCIAENSISPDANKPDDIIQLLSGKSIEISNTDAEGRLVLADGVFYAKNVLQARTVIDIATLTGAHLFASGRLHCSVLCNHDGAEAAVLRAGKKSGELAHPLPYAPDLHFCDLHSQVADMKNANLGRTEGPLSSIAGLFIAAQFDFAEDFNWIHIDFANAVFSKDRATGFGPGLICALLSKYLPANIAK